MRNSAFSVPIRLVTFLANPMPVDAGRAHIPGGLQMPNSLVLTNNLGGPGQPLATHLHHTGTTTRFLPLRHVCIVSVSLVRCGAPSVDPEGFEPSSSS